MFQRLPCLLLISWSCLFLPVFSDAQTFSEILGRPENTSITVNVLFSQAVQVYFEYGVQKGQYPYSTQPVTTSNNEPVEARLSGLSPDTRYYYRTRYRLPGEAIFESGEEHSFTTQRLQGKTFIFTVESDPHPYDKKCYAPLWNIALQNQLADSADFMIDMGDTFGDDHNPFTITNKQVQQLHLDARGFFSRVCHSLPFFFCQGNHEGESGYYLLQTPPDNLAVWETIWRKLYWPNPFPDDFYSGNTETEPYGIGNPENYYAWEWGDALFVVIDAYRYYTVNAKPRGWAWTLGKTQYDWLKSTLAKSTAKYKFVFIHHLLGEARGAANLAKQFEWGGYDQKGSTWEFTANRPGWEMPIHQLMVKNKVSVLFQGHDHLYAREEMDGLICQTVPMPSDSSYNLGMIANGDAFGGIKLSGSGHIRITVSPEKSTIDFVSAVLPHDESPGNMNRKILYSYNVLPAREATGLHPIPDKTTGYNLSVYPNPFCRYTEIAFALQESSQTEISITDHSGRTVDRIDAGMLTPGYHSFTWTPASIKGQPVTPGLYICRVRTKQGILTTKMILSAASAFMTNQN